MAKCQKSNKKINKSNGFQINLMIISENTSDFQDGIVQNLHSNYVTNKSIQVLCRIDMTQPNKM